METAREMGLPGAPRLPFCDVCGRVDGGVRAWAVGPPGHLVKCRSMRQKQARVAFAYESRGPRVLGIHRDDHDHRHPGGDRGVACSSADRTCQKAKGLGSGRRGHLPRRRRRLQRRRRQRRLWRRRLWRRRLWRRRQLTQASSRPRQQSNSHGKTPRPHVVLTSAISLCTRSHGHSRLLSHLPSDEALSAPGIDLLTLSFVAVVDAIPLDDRPLAI
jgi:hypothetical protein